LPDGALAYQLGLASDRLDERIQPLDGVFADRGPRAYGAVLPPCGLSLLWEAKFSFAARPPASRGSAVGEPAPFVLATDGERTSESRSFGSRRAKDGP
jgi:hypothetical protein